MSRRSIRFRLTAWYAAILAFTFAVMGVGIWLTLRKSIENTVDSDLQSRLVRMREFLDHQEGGVSQLADELQENAAFAPSGTQFRLRDASGRWIYQSPDARGWIIQEADTRLTATVNGSPWRILTAQIPAGTIQIGVPLDAFYAMLGNFTWTLALASPLVLVLASAGGYWMSRRALAPVEEIASRAREISAYNLSGRLPLRGSGDELDHLSEILNAMLGRLEAAFRRMTQFTADASHELRTPVAIVQTTAEIASSKPRTVEEHARSWKLVLAESERISKLIEDLLTLARADAGSDGILPEPMDLAECVREACAGVRVLAENVGLRLSTELPESCGTLGDYEALRRLCLILLDNAIKYTPAGGEVRVTLRVSGAAILEVSDTGIGIPASDQRHVFDRFYRVSTDRSRKSGGAGLGLAIAQWIVSRHGGTVDLESTPGAGTTIGVTLPVNVASSEIRSSLLQNQPSH